MSNIIQELKDYVTWCSLHSLNKNSAKVFLQYTNQLKAQAQQ